MAGYLVVAHHTATSALLIQRLQEIAAGDAAAAFTMLIPEAHVQHALVCDEQETRALALRRAAEAHRALSQAGLRLLRTEIGCASPLAAITDELRRRPEEHDAIVLSTFAPGKSHWLSTDLPSRLHRDQRLPVLPVYEGGDAVWAASEPVRTAVARGESARARVPQVVEVVVALTSPRELLPIAALLLLHVLIGVTLAVLYSRTFLIGEALIVVFFSSLIVWLWFFDKGDTTPRPRAGPQGGLR